MSREKTYVDGLIEYLKRNAYFCFKHNDIGTAGIPDVSATGHGLTGWIEVKNLEPGETLEAVVEQVQITTAMEMHAAGGHVCFAVYSTNRRANPGLTLWAPWMMRRQCSGFEPLAVPASDGRLLNVAQELYSAGACRIASLNHRLVLRWLRDLDRRGRLTL
jgi:hypothetical protein